MLSDQDDVWLPGKLSLYAAKMRELEQTHGAHSPILLYSLVDAVDQNLEHLAGSARFNRRIKGSARLLALFRRNVAVGATCMGNSALLEKARPLPDGLMFHDWWLALVACATGYLVRLNYPSMLYRQHGGNASQALQISGILSVLKKPHWQIASMQRHVQRSRQQLALLEAHLKDAATPNAAAQMSFILRGRGLGRAMYRFWEFINIV
jgi:hypothetical protein